MVSKRWVHSNTCVYNVGYHLIWCPKYRRKVLVRSVATRLRQLLNKKAKEIDTQIETMEILEEHVHLFVKTKPTASPHWIVQQLKGFWTRSYYCESVGHISEDTVKKYIEDQTGK